MPVSDQTLASVPRELVLELLALTPIALRDRTISELRLSLLSSPYRLVRGRISAFQVIKILKAYRAAKTGAQRVVGRTIFAGVSADKGDDFCKRIQYCRNKSKLAELLAHSGNPEFAAIAARYSETIDWIRGVLAEIIELVGDTVIPVSFLLFALKEGLDHLCHCCPTCKGLGADEIGTSCQACGGSGVGPRVV